MHVHFLDPYRPGRSPVHRLDARLKLVLTLAFILTVALTPVGAWPVYVLLLSLLLAVEVLSELGLVFYLKRAMLALPFVLAALPVIFTLPGPELFSLKVGSLSLAASLTGLERFISIALKSWISVQSAVLLASCTEFPDLLSAMRAVHFPRLLVSIFSLMWRYLFVLVDEALRLMRARQSRSTISDHPGLKQGGSLGWRARVTGGLAGSLFLRAFERSDRIYMAMVARGYDGEVRSRPIRGMSASDRRILIAGLALLLLLLLFAGLFWA